MYSVPRVKLGNANDSNRPSTRKMTTLQEAIIVMNLSVLFSTHEKEFFFKSYHPV